MRTTCENRDERKIKTIRRKFDFKGAYRKNGTCMENRTFFMLKFRMHWELIIVAFYHFSISSQTNTYFIDIHTWVFKNEHQLRHFVSRKWFWRARTVLQNHWKLCHCFTHSYWDVKLTLTYHGVILFDLFWFITFEEELNWR